jgi:hypothetical protein
MSWTTCSACRTRLLFEADQHTVGDYEATTARTLFSSKTTKDPHLQVFLQSGRRDSNSGPLVPQRNPHATTDGTHRQQSLAAMRDSAPSGRPGPAWLRSLISDRLGQDWATPAPVVRL